MKAHEDRPEYCQIYSYNVLVV